MSEQDSHSGYRNYETFLVANYLNGNYTSSDTYDAVQEIIRAFDEKPVTDLADALKGYFEHDREVERIQRSSGIVADLFAGALSEVDWYQLADTERGEVRIQQGDES